MANISIDMSQSTYNAINIDGAPPSGQSADLADMLAVFFVLDQNFAATHPSTSGSSIGANSARLDYADGGYTTFAGVTFADPNAATGTANASHVESHYPGNYHLTYEGGLNYRYTLSGNNATLAYEGGTMSHMTMQSLLPQDSPGYSKVFGNLTLSASGNVVVDTAGFFSGTVTELDAQSDHVVTSSKLSGDFDISGNALAVGTGLQHTKVAGTLTGFDEQYADGGNVTITEANIPVNGNTIVSEKLLADGSNLPGDDSIIVTLPATLVTPFSVASGAGNDKITISGGGGQLSVNAGDGNDSITFGDDGHSVDGGNGTDTAIFAGARSAYTVLKTADGYTVHANAAGSATDSLANIERLQFSDTSVAFDISGTGGQAYRLYQAAFDRTPDATGLGYWIHAMDGGTSLRTVASQFMASKEFTDLYGASLSDAAFVDQLYQNVLHRAGDTAGVQYWNGILAANSGARPDLLASFGESQENQAALIGTIGNGFSFTHYG